MRVLLVLLFVLPFSMYAQEWKWFSTQGTSEYYIRKHSNNSNDTKVWIKEVGPKIEYKNSAKKKAFVNGYELFLCDINCTDMQIATLRSTIYTSQGKVLQDRSTPSYLVEFQDVLPDSIGELWLNEACELFNPSEVYEEEDETTEQ